MFLYQQYHLHIRAWNVRIAHTYELFISWFVAFLSADFAATWPIGREMINDYHRDLKEGQSSCRGYAISFRADLSLLACLVYFFTHRFSNYLGKPYRRTCKETGELGETSKVGSGRDCTFSACVMPLYRDTFIAGSSSRRRRQKMWDIEQSEPTAERLTRMTLMAAAAPK